jgi:hypothetical protein
MAHWSCEICGWTVPADLGDEEPDAVGDLLKFRESIYVTIIQPKPYL